MVAAQRRASEADTRETGGRGSTSIDGSESGAATASSGGGATSSTSTASAGAIGGMDSSTELLSPSAEAVRNITSGPGSVSAASSSAQLFSIAGATAPPCAASSAAAYPYIPGAALTASGGGGVSGYNQVTVAAQYAAYLAMVQQQQQQQFNAGARSQGPPPLPQAALQYQHGLNTVPPPPFPYSQHPQQQQFLPVQGLEQLQLAQQQRGQLQLAQPPFIGAPQQQPWASGGAAGQYPSGPLQMQIGSPLFNPQQQATQQFNYAPQYSASTAPLHGIGGGLGQQLSTFNFPQQQQQLLLPYGAPPPPFFSPFYSAPMQLLQPTAAEYGTAAATAAAAAATAATAAAAVYSADPRFNAQLYSVDPLMPFDASVGPQHYLPQQQQQQQHWQRFNPLVGGPFEPSGGGLPAPTSTWNAPAIDPSLRPPPAPNVSIDTRAVSSLVWGTLELGVGIAVVHVFPESTIDRDIVVVTFDGIRSVFSQDPEWGADIARDRRIRFGASAGAASHTRNDDDDGGGDDSNGDGSGGSIMVREQQRLRRKQQHQHTRRTVPRHGVDDDDLGDGSAPSQSLAEARRSSAYVDEYGYADGDDVDDADGDGGRSGDGDRLRYFDENDYFGENGDAGRNARLQLRGLQEQQQQQRRRREAHAGDTFTSGRRLPVPRDGTGFDTSISDSQYLEAAATGAAIRAEGTRSQRHRQQINGGTGGRPANFNLSRGSGRLTPSKYGSRNINTDTSVDDEMGQKYNDNDYAADYDDEVAVVENDDNDDNNDDDDMTEYFAPVDAHPAGYKSTLDFDAAVDADACGGLDPFSLHSVHRSLTFSMKKGTVQRITASLIAPLAAPTASLVPMPLTTWGAAFSFNGGALSPTGANFNLRGTDPLLLTRPPNFNLESRLQSAPVAAGAQQQWHLQLPITSRTTSPPTQLSAIRGGAGGSSSSSTAAAAPPDSATSSGGAAGAGSARSLAAPSSAASATPGAAGRTNRGQPTSTFATRPDSGLLSSMNAPPQALHSTGSKPAAAPPLPLPSDASHVPPPTATSTGGPTGTVSITKLFQLPAWSLQMSVMQFVAERLSDAAPLRTASTTVVHASSGTRGASSSSFMNGEEEHARDYVLLHPRHHVHHYTNSSVGFGHGAQLRLHPSLQSPLAASSPAAYSTAHTTAATAAVGGGVYSARDTSAATFSSNGQHHPGDGSAPSQSALVSTRRTVRLVLDHEAWYTLYTAFSGSVATTVNLKDYELLAGRPKSITTLFTARLRDSTARSMTLWRDAAGVLEKCRAASAIASTPSGSTSARPAGTSADAAVAEAEPRDAYPPPPYQRHTTDDTIDHPRPGGGDDDASSSDPPVVLLMNFEAAEAEGRPHPLIIDPPLAALGDLPISNLNWILGGMGLEGLGAVPPGVYAGLLMPLCALLQYAGAAARVGGGGLAAVSALVNGTPAVAAAASVDARHVGAGDAAAAAAAAAAPMRYPPPDSTVAGLEMVAVIEGSSGGSARAADTAATGTAAAAEQADRVAASDSHELRHVFARVRYRHQPAWAAAAADEAARIDVYWSRMPLFVARARRRLPRLISQQSLGDGGQEAAAGGVVGGEELRRRNAAAPNVVDSANGVNQLQMHNTQQTQTRMRPFAITSSTAARGRTISEPSHLPAPQQPHSNPAAATPPSAESGAAASGAAAASLRTYGTSPGLAPFAQRDTAAEPAAAASRRTLQLQPATSPDQSSARAVAISRSIAHPPSRSHHQQGSSSARSPTASADACVEPGLPRLPAATGPPTPLSSSLSPTTNASGQSGGHSGGGVTGKSTVVARLQPASSGTEIAAPLLHSARTSAAGTSTATAAAIHSVSPSPSPTNFNLGSSRVIAPSPPIYVSALPSLGGDTQRSADSSGGDSAGGSDSGSSQWMSGASSNGSNGAAAATAGGRANRNNTSGGNAAAAGGHTRHTNDDGGSARVSGGADSSGVSRRYIAPRNSDEIGGDIGGGGGGMSATPFVTAQQLGATTTQQSLRSDDIQPRELAAAPGAASVAAATALPTGSGAADTMRMRRYDFPRYDERTETAAASRGEHSSQAQQQRSPQQQQSRLQRQPEPASPLGWFQRPASLDQRATSSTAPANAAPPSSSSGGWLQRALDLASGFVRGARDDDDNDDEEEEEEGDEGGTVSEDDEEGSDVSDALQSIDTYDTDSDYEELLGAEDVDDTAPTAAVNVTQRSAAGPPSISTAVDASHYADSSATGVVARTALDRQHGTATAGPTSNSQLHGRAYNDTTTQARSEVYSHADTALEAANSAPALQYDARPATASVSTRDADYHSIGVTPVVSSSQQAASDVGGIVIPSIPASASATAAAAPREGYYDNSYDDASEVEV